jgi:FkbM family methyltransferase
MKTRFVSAMFDLSDEVAFRDPLGMIEKTTFLSSSSLDLTLFVSRNLIAHFPALGENVRVVPMETAELPLWKHHAEVDRARERYWPSRDARSPTGVHLVQSSKHQLVRRAITDFPSDDPEGTWAYWIDFGKDFIGRNDVEAIQGSPGADVRLHLCNVVDPNLWSDLLVYFQSYRFSVCGGLVGARESVWPGLARRLDNVFELYLSRGLGHGEEALYNYLLQDKEFLRDTKLHLTIGDYQELASNYYAPRENKGHCAWVLRRMIETGRRDLLALVQPFVDSDPQLAAIAGGVFSKSSEMGVPRNMTRYVYDPACGSMQIMGAPAAIIGYPAETTTHIVPGRYERDLVDWAIQFAAPDKQFLDIGAHMGSWTLVLAEHFREVHAFEPQRLVHQQLCGNVSLNGLTNVFAHNVGIDVAPTRLTLQRPGVDRGSSSARPEVAHRFIEQGIALSPETINVVPLDSFADVLTSVGLVKIDVEGLELRVLMGALQVLRNNDLPRLFVECWSADWYRDDKEKLLSFLEDLGYQIVRIRGYDDMLLAEKP